MMGKALDAMRSRFQTRNIPKTIKGRFNALMRKEKKDTARVAERLGVSRRTVQRYASGKRKIENNPQVAERLTSEVSKDHQPRVRAKAEREARQRGLQVETRASFGFKADGDTSDDDRMRRMSEDIPDRLVPEIFEAMRTGDEDKLQELIGEGLAEEYFRMPGTDAASLEVTFGDIDYIELDFR